jgi:hypothetical protein
MWKDVLLNLSCRLLSKIISFCGNLRIMVAESRTVERRQTKVFFLNSERCSAEDNFVFLHESVTYGLLFRCLLVTHSE